MSPLQESFHDAIYLKALIKRRVREKGRGVIKNHSSRVKQQIENVLQFGHAILGVTENDTGCAA